MKHQPIPSKYLTEQHFCTPQNMPFLEIRTTRNSVLPYAKHFHSEFCIGIIIEGRTHLTLSGEEYTVQQGDVVLIAPGQAHSCNPLDNIPRGYHMLFIDTAWLSEHTGMDLSLKTGHRTSQPVVRDTRIFAEAVKVVESILATQSDCEKDRFCALVDRLVIASGIAENQPETKGNLKHLLLLKAAIELPAGYSGKDPASSVSALAHTAGMRRESFSRSVRRVTGLSPHTYMHCLRLERGRRYLQKGKSITEAALASGYADQSHFHRMFLRFYSVTPGCYRKSRSHSFKK